MSPTTRSAARTAENENGAIIAHALELGFDVAGFAAPDSLGRTPARFREFVALGRHGDMAWLAEKSDRRASPETLWPDVKSVLMVGMNYGPGIDPLEILTRTNVGAVSVSAQGKDYHDVVKKRLKQLGRWIVECFGGEVKVFVDTAPVLEKPLAAAAGLGWQGKHTNLVSRNFGSWLFLGSVFTTLQVADDPAENDHCGTCRACLDVCPTGAFPAPYQLDARRCISYLTIEYKGHIPADLREPIGNRIFGCDDCLAVCPWNKFARRATEMELQPRDALMAPLLGELSQLDDTSFRAMFSGSNIKRTGRDRFLRNVMIGIGNSGEPALAALAQARLKDNSALVRAKAVWAISRLLTGRDFAALRSQHAADEPDPQVRREWYQGLDHG